MYSVVGHYTKILNATDNGICRNGFYDRRYRKNPRSCGGGGGALFVTLPNLLQEQIILINEDIMIMVTINEAVTLAAGNPMNVWYVIVGILLLVLLVGSLRLAGHHASGSNAHKPRFIEVGRERDMFYVPGDENVKDNDEIDDGF